MTRATAEVYREAPQRIATRSAIWEERVGSACRVWRGEGVWLKRHPDRRTWEQERWALQELLPPIQEHPALLDAACPWLLLSEAPGGPAEGALAHRAAGAWLRRLHALPVPEADSVPLGEALPRRARSTAQRLAGRAAPRALERAVACVEAVAPLAGPRVFCHRDFEPRNWLWDGACLRVLDFGHARMDLAMGDLAKLAGDLWRRDTALKVAFLEGYGALSTRDEALLEGALALHGLLSLDWALRHGDAALEALGRGLLAEGGLESPGHDRGPA